MLITLEEAKMYLRVDTSSENSLIQNLLESAESICRNVARMECGEVADEEDILRAAIFYTLAYLYEHREEADHQELMKTLRAILASVRRSRF